MEVQSPVKSCLEKYQLLIKRLKKSDCLAVAFSGGVDSTLLLKAAVDALKKEVVAITSTSCVHAGREISAAKEVALHFGVEHICFDPGMMDDKRFVENTARRCYFCKRRMFEKMKEVLCEKGDVPLVHGVNIDDLGDYRPGLEAAQELGISAPMVEAELTKKEIRQLAAYFKLEVADKPAMSCLATRIPYGEPITEEALKKVEAAESALSEMGFYQFRVRHHGNVARIEFSASDLKRLFEAKLLGRVVEKVKEAGYIYVAADLEGYGQGRMNRVLDM